MSRRWLLAQGLTLSQRLGYRTGRALALLRQSPEWSAAELKAHQDQAIQNLMYHCYQHVPYYRSVMQERALLPADFQTTQDLSKLPYLTRNIIRQQKSRLRAENYPDSKCQFRRSGGTTGEPIEVAADARARFFEVAAYVRGFEWMNYSLGEPMVRLFGGSLGLTQRQTVKSRLHDWVLNSRFLPAFELTPDNASKYVDVINEAGEAVLVGYASVVRNLAEYVRKQHLQVHGLKSVICTAEYTPDVWRIEIGAAFNAPVFCYYGCGEINSIAYECAGEEGYLVTEEHIVLEVANDESNVFTDEGRGEACITTLFNYAMPLIRYRNGDMLTLEHASGEWPHRRIKLLEGRVVDQLLRADGHRVSGAFVPHLVFKSEFPVWKYQVVQTDYDRLRFHYLLENGVTILEKTQEELTSVFRNHLGSEVKVEFVLGDIQYSSSRKHRFVINKLLTEPS